MTGHESKRNLTLAMPPRKINVQEFAESRAPELEALHSIVSNRLNSDFRTRRNKRRRTSAYDNQAAKKRCGKKRKLAVNKSHTAAISEGVPPRHVRRRLELRKNPANGFTTSGDGAKRLRTHVWHAKRFAMTKLWGFHLPLGLHGRGRGSRALLKWYKNGAVVHDASYYSAVQLEGSEVALMSVLRMVLEPSPSSQSEEITNGILSGAIYGLAMLHHVGAPISQLIAPVTYVWRPFHLANAENGGDDHNSGGRTGLQSSESCSSHRQLWVWIHASSFSEGYDALKFACQKQMNENGILINFFSLEGQLAKLEVMGSKSFQLLQKILRPESCNPKVSGQLRKCAVEGADHDSEFNKYPVLENEDSMSSRAVLSFTVRDPRRIADVVPMAAPTVKIYEAEHEPGKDVTVFGGLANTKESVLPSCSEHEEDSSFFGKMTLWDASIRVTCPVEENVLCSERNHLRMDFICLDDQKSLILNSSTESQVSRSCPVMLFRNNSQMGSFMGWSLVVPISWVKVFWIAFISKGARAIGQREKQWIACEVGLPVFPTDFLDSNAYSFFMENARAAQDQKIERLPPAVRPLKVPVPPPWNSIRAAIQNGSVCRTEDIEYNLLPNSRSRNGDIPPLRVDGNPFDGIVARTSGVLADFLNEINGAQLFLFPPCPNGKPSIPELMKDESKHGALQHGVTQTTWDRKLCFVRVLLYAYKEGVFEEGAVICAPCLADISLWTSRSEKNEAGFQIPKSLVNSYFKEQSSGKWELQLPEDPAAIESYRLPLGFVTSGFVRGSKKPVAVGFCEAVILAGLREEQKGIPEKQRRNEIYVLVRNLRSSAYRLGLASIVLEQGEDLEFL